MTKECSQCAQDAEPDRDLCSDCQFTADAKGETTMNEQKIPIMTATLETILGRLNDKHWKAVADVERLESELSKAKDYETRCQVELNAANTLAAMEPQ